MSRPVDPSGTLQSLFGRFPPPSDDVQADIYREQHMLLTRQLLPMGLINMFAGLLVIAAVFRDVNIMTCALWFSLIFVGSVFQLAGWMKYRKLDEPERVSGGYLRKSEWGCLIAGTVWGMTAVLFSGSDNGQQHFFYFMQGGMSAGVVSLLTPLPRHVLRFILPCLLPTILSPLYSEGELIVVTSIMLTVFLFALLNSSFVSYKMLTATVRRTRESLTARKNLVDAIEATNDAFAFYADDGELILANKRHHDLIGEGPALQAQSEDFYGVDTIKRDGRWLLQSRHKIPEGGAVLVHTDVTALKMRERELVEARKEAEEADQAKSRFLSTMSHELRTPLNIILGFSRLMASDSKVKLNWDEVAEYSDSINESGTHLLHLIDDIIDYSKVGLDRFLLEPAPVDIRSLLSKTVALAANFEHIKDLSDFDVQVSPALGRIRADEAVCQRIIMNLLNNAIQFRGSDRRIIVRAGLNSEGCPFVAVRDFGNGIPEQELERVFDAFYQSDNGLDRGNGGTGLGLTLCRHLAQLHDGEIVLKSRVGVGTTAMFVLPKETHLPDSAEQKQIAA
ncbi:MAG: ATP-binding protein [Henriciella sp.]|nr:ATP-binding protein [Henriciella sp.]